MSNENDPIKSAIEFLEKIKNQEEVTVKFKKKDDTVRVMRCTLDFSKIPKEKVPKDVNLGKILKLVYKSKLIHVFDLDKQDWRSVPFDRSEWVEMGDDRYYVQHK